jgi:hypothetical protein
MGEIEEKESGRSSDHSAFFRNEMAYSSCPLGAENGIKDAQRLFCLLIYFVW